MSRLMTVYTSVNYACAVDFRTGEGEAACLSRLWDMFVDIARHPRHWRSPSEKL